METERSKPIQHNIYSLRTEEMSIGGFEQHKDCEGK